MKGDYEMKKVSLFYTYYTRGLIDSQSSSIHKLKLAAVNLLKCYLMRPNDYIMRLYLLCLIKLGLDDTYKNFCEERAAQGYVGAYSTCGIFFANNPKYYDEQQSLYYFDRGMKANDAKSFHDLANLYYLGSKAFDKDLEKAETIALKGLALNDPHFNGHICYLLGRINLDKKTYKFAFNYFNKALEYGYRKACHYLALMYRDGLEVDENLDKYMDYLLMDLNVDSAIELGGVFASGEIVPMDNFVAFNYFDYAAKQGDPMGALMCAGLISDGQLYNEKKVDKYLEIAFRSEKGEQLIKDSFDELEKALGEKASKLLREKAEKYWATSKIFA